MVTVRIGARDWEWQRFDWQMRMPALLRSAFDSQRIAHVNRWQCPPRQNPAAEVDLRIDPRVILAVYGRRSPIAYPHVPGGALAGADGDSDAPGDGTRALFDWFWGETGLASADERRDEMLRRFGDDAGIDLDLDLLALRYDRKVCFEVRTWVDYDIIRLVGPKMPGMPEQYIVIGIPVTLGHRIVKRATCAGEVETPLDPLTDPERQEILEKRLRANTEDERRIRRSLRENELRLIEGLIEAGAEDLERLREKAGDLRRIIEGLGG